MFTISLKQTATGLDGVRGKYRAFKWWIIHLKSVWGEELRCAIVTETAKVYRCYKLLCYFSVPSSKYWVSPLSSLRLTKAHGGYRAAMDTLSNTALLSNDCRLFGGEKEKQGGRGGGMKEEGQSLTQASNGQVQSSKHFNAGPCWCSSLLYQSHLCKLICQMQRLNGFMLLCESVRACVCVCVREKSIYVWVCHVESVWQGVSIF